MFSNQKGMRGFSLLEILVVLVVVALLFVIAFSTYGNLQDRAVSSACASNLRQIGVATMAYAADHNNYLPYYYYEANNTGGSGAITGTWFYNLAPYLNVPRTEVAGIGASTERTYLGKPGNRIASPCVFTCPGHRPTESNNSWKPAPMTFPSERPVSYAPPLEARGPRSQRGSSGWRDHPTGVRYYPVTLAEIHYPGSKIWISDSPVADVLNVSEGRWNPPTAQATNWARQGFTRHANGGNALFYDGHVEWIPLRTFTDPANGSLSKTIHLYFNPFRAPELDQ